MHQLKLLWKISLIICLILVVFACATNRGISNTEAEFSFTADGTSEGIFLHFNNIPVDAVHLSIFVEDITSNNQIYNQVLFWNNDLFGFKISMNDLTELRNTPNLLIPFAKEGHEYKISVSIFTDKNLDEWTDHTSTNVIAKGGIYLTNNPSLMFTDDNLNLTLSVEPTFSEEVEFYQNGLFSYSVMVILDEQNSRGGGGNWNDFTFPAHEVYNGSREYFGFTGHLPVVGSVQVNLIHGNMEWIVGVAKTEEVIISF